MTRKHEFYIDGAWVAPAIPHDFEVIDPSTEEPCATISLGGAADTDAAVAAARTAFAIWSQTDPAERLAHVKRILEVYNARAEDMAQAISLEMGAPIDMARQQQVTAGSWHISNFIKAFDQIEFIRPLGPHAPNDRIAMEPIGVVGADHAVELADEPGHAEGDPGAAGGLHDGAETLRDRAAVRDGLRRDRRMRRGCRPASSTSSTATAPGSAASCPSHPDVEMISFTGSTRAGIAITKAAADSLKRVCLELGGKGANLVFADADEKAVKRGVLHCFNNSGQSCNAPTRMLVERVDLRSGGRDRPRGGRGDAGRLGA